MLKEVLQAIWKCCHRKIHIYRNEGRAPKMVTIWKSIFKYIFLSFLKLLKDNWLFKAKIITIYYEVHTFVEVKYITISKHLLFILSCYPAIPKGWRRTLQVGHLKTLRSTVQYLLIFSLLRKELPRFCPLAGLADLSYVRFLSSCSFSIEGEPIDSIQTAEAINSLFSTGPPRSASSSWNNFLLSLSS